MLQSGDVDKALSEAEHVLEGEVHMGGQEHFYLETQACIAVPKNEDDELEIFSSTQNPAETQVSAQFAVDIVDILKETLSEVDRNVFLYLNVAFKETISALETRRPHAGRGQQPRHVPH